MSFTIGQTVGPYRITGLLGRGGMGRVFQAEHTITRRIEALKVLRDLPENTAEAARFEREIQLQAQLQHPNIAGVHTAFRAGSELVLVMELVEGWPLDRVMEAGRLPLAAAIDYTCQALAALSFAHAHGVVHRDISPGNLMVTANGTVKLTDFGLARTPADARQSQSGAPVGSPGYMPPEQVKGSAALDARSDLYSLGAVLYELVTGSQVVAGGTAFELMRAQVEQTPVPARTVNAAVPVLLDAIIDKALRKDPLERFQSAEEFRADLERARATLADRRKAVQVAASEPHRSKTLTRWRTRRLVWLCALLALVVSIGWWRRGARRVLAPPAPSMGETIVQQVPRGDFTAMPQALVPPTPPPETAAPAAKRPVSHSPAARAARPKSLRPSPSMVDLAATSMESAQPTLPAVALPAQESSSGAPAVSTPLVAQPEGTPANRETESKSKHNVFRRTFDKLRHPHRP